VLREWEVPVPAAGQIVLKTEACGVCRTDLHAANGDWPLKPTLPFIPGHEAIGSVTAIGANVTIVKEGDWVGVPWLYSACGHCEYCLSAWETLCPDAQFGGYTKNGDLRSAYSPIRIMYRTYQRGSPRRRPHFSSAPASRPTRESRKRGRAPASGSRSRV
jgi:D-arabinose 1-dehydrogenase-like Zn-dependent alcohol dehydrogenase